MKQEMIEKRESLKALSRVAAEMVKAGEAGSVNDGLLMIYQQQGHTEVHSFKKWWDMGYTVRRGEKALLLWGEPIKAANQEKKKDDEKDEYKFFPLAFVFSQLQVDKLK